MSKNLTSFFLILAMLCTGLTTLLAIPASAVLSNPLECNIIGQFINKTIASAPCEQCPVDYYCLLQSDSTGNKSATRPGRDGNLNSEVVPCPAGTTTVGFTLHPVKGTLLSKDQDGFIKGKLATDPSQCKAPDFKCPASEPRLIQESSGNVKCFAACPSNETTVLDNGVQTCGVKCRSGETNINSKCFAQCESGSTLTIVDNSKPICVAPTVALTCKIEGQILVGQECRCPLGTTINSLGGACEIPYIPCPENYFGKSQPNCLPCPNGSTSEAGNAVEFKDCKPLPCNDITGQIRFNDGKCQCPNQLGKLIVAADGRKACGICPTGDLLIQSGTENTGEYQYNCQKPAPVQETPKQEKNQDGGICGGWLIAVCGGAVVGVACLFKVFGFCAGESNSSAPKPSYQSETPVKLPKRSDIKYVIKKNSTAVAGQTCTQTNSQYYESVLQDAAPGTQKHPHGNEQYLWIATEVSGTGQNMRTTSFRAAVFTGENTPNFNLQCLMQRFAKKQGVKYGSKEFVVALRSSGILHGLNKARKAECYNLTTLLSYLGEENLDGISTNVDTYTLLKGDQVVAGPFKTEQEAKDKYETLKKNYLGSILNQGATNYIRDNKPRGQIRNNFELDSSEAYNLDYNDNYNYNSNTLTVTQTGDQSDTESIIQTENNSWYQFQNSNDYPEASSNSGCEDQFAWLFGGSLCDQQSTGYMKVFEKISANAFESDEAFSLADDSVEITQYDPETSSEGVDESGDISEIIWEAFDFEIDENTNGSYGLSDECSNGDEYYCISLIGADTNRDGSLDFIASNPDSSLTDYISACSSGKVTSNFNGKLTENTWTNNNGSTGFNLGASDCSGYDNTSDFTNYTIWSTSFGPDYYQLENTTQLVDENGYDVSVDTNLLNSFGYGLSDYRNDDSYTNTAPTYEGGNGQSDTVYSTTDLPAYNSSPNQWYNPFNFDFSGNNTSNNDGVDQSYNPFNGSSILGLPADDNEVDQTDTSYSTTKIQTNNTDLNQWNSSFNN